MLRAIGDPALLAGLVVAVALGLWGQSLVQAWSAFALGDRSGVRAGFGLPRRRQLDPLGTVCAVLAASAWSFVASVPMETRFRRQRPRAAVALLTGPAYLFGLLVGATAGWHALITSPSPNTHLLAAAVAARSCCAGLLAVSLIPVPPFPLGRVIWMYVPTTGGWQRARYLLEEEAVGSLIGFAVIMLPLLFRLVPNVIDSAAQPFLRLASHLVGAPV